MGASKEIWQQPAHTSPMVLNCCNSFLNSFFIKVYTKNSVRSNSYLLLPLAMTKLWSSCVLQGPSSPMLGTVTQLTPLLKAQATSRGYQRRLTHIQMPPQPGAGQGQGVLAEPGPGKCFRLPQFRCHLSEHWSPTQTVQPTAQRFQLWGSV